MISEAVAEGKKETNVVTIREFQRNFYDCLRKLPLVVTKNGENFIVVTLCDKNVVRISNNDDVVTSALEEKEDVVTLKKQVSPPRGSKIDTPPPSMVKEVPVKKESPIKSQKIRKCVHQVIWGLGQCGICGPSERKYK